MTTSLISQNLSALLASFPASSTDPDAAMAGYRIAVSEFDDRQVSLAAAAFIQGKVHGHNTKFAPSAAELAQECRKHMSETDWAEFMNRPKLPPPTYRPGSLAPFEVKANKARATHSHRRVLFENVSIDDFKALIRDGKTPVGSLYSAILQTVFAPEARQKLKGAA